MITFTSNPTKFFILHEPFEKGLDCIETEARHEESGMPRSGEKGWLNTVHAYTLKKICVGYVNNFVANPDREVCFRSFWPDGTIFCEISREIKEEGATIFTYDSNGKRVDEADSELKNQFLNAWNNSN